MAPLWALLNLRFIEDFGQDATHARHIGPSL
jgi:hypothetical protein